MLFWVVAALLTIGASLAVLVPLAGGRRTRPVEGSHDAEVYRDQLAELDRDTERGLIQRSEADEARAEIARRLIRADGLGKVVATSAEQGSARWLGAAAVLLVPLVSWGIYGAIGSPDLPSQPLAERLAKNPAESSVDELLARAEAHLAANPSDGRGWDVLAPIYLRIGRLDDAVTAYRNAIGFAGSTASRESALGEALAGVAGGLVSADARAAFERALVLEPRQPKASFYLATALAQEGQLAQAAAAWQAMLTDLPADSPWRGAAEQAIIEVKNRTADAKAPAPGPGQDEIDAAAAMSETDRNAMIETMVARLDEKLRQNPHDVEGWSRLVRSYLVLGRTDAAREAVKRGVTALGSDSEDAKRLVAFSGSLGLAETD